MSLFGAPEGTPCCCLSSCCPGIPLPDCITLSLSSSCCEGETASVVLTAEDAATCDGGESRPFTAAETFCDGSPNVIYSGALDPDWCVAAELSDATVLVFCCLDPETGEPTWWIYISDNDGSHTWYNYAASPQFHRLTLVSCDPLLLQLNDEPTACGSDCVFTWQAACFIAGTTVDTPSGLVNIETIKEGDIVLDVHGERVRVIAIMKTEVEELVCLRGSSGFDTGVTPEHPFFSLDMSTTVEAATLKPGDRLPLGNVITATHRERGKFTVYNLSVDGSNTFIADGYAVHNKGQS